MGLDYKKLSEDLDKFLKTQTKEDFEKWLKMDRKRMRDAKRNSNKNKAK